MQQVNLNLVPGGVNPIVYASQNDDKRTIRFELVSGGDNDVYVLSGNETITAKITKPDGTAITIPITNPGSGKHYVDLVNGVSDYDQDGVYLGEVSITKGEKVLGTGNFVLKVEADPYDGSVQKKIVIDNPATFSTSLPDVLVSCKCKIDDANGIDSMDVINAGPTYARDSVPYQLRQTPITANRTLEKLIGVSCAFNQLINSGDTSINTTSGHKYVTKINNVWSIIAGGSAVTIVDDSSDMVIDLTACFGSEVADYLYTLESNTAGSGINLFRQLFPEDYYAYQTAHLESSKPVAKVIKDSNDQTIATYPLGSDEIRGLLKVENGQLVAYGDIHPSDGNGTEVFDIVDLGTKDWSKHPTLHAFYTAQIEDFAYDKTISGTDYACGIMAEYLFVQNRDFVEGTINLYHEISTGFNRCFICDDTKYATMTANEFKTAMSGKYLIYEKATPTAKSYTPFTNPMICGSTEEFTDSRSVKMFCGHDSIYADNISFAHIDFGQTVTDGTLDVVHGILTPTGGSPVSVTPASIQTFSGVNNVFSNGGGDITAVYLDVL